MKKKWSNFIQQDIWTKDKCFLSTFCKIRSICRFIHIFLPLKIKHIHSSSHLTVVHPCTQITKHNHSFLETNRWHLLTGVVITALELVEIKPVDLPNLGCGDRHVVSTILGVSDVLLTLNVCEKRSARLSTSSLALPLLLLLMLLLMDAFQ